MDEHVVKLSKRSGTEDLGKLYELKVAALLALRCVENPIIKRAWFASNVNHAYDVDDVILYVTDENDVCTAYLMQLKHQDDPKNLPRKDFLYDAKVKKKSNMTEDFSLHKYLRSYLNIKESLEGGVEDGLVESLRKADEIVYVLYTNRPLGAVYEFLCVCEDELGLLDTGGKIYGFDPKKLAFDDRYLRQLKLFTEQVHVAAIDELMKKELRRIADGVNIKQLEVNTVLRRYLDFVQTCIKGVKDSFFDALTNNDVTARLTSFLLRDYRVRFALNSPNLPEFLLWNDIIEQRGLVVVEATESTSYFLKSYVSAKVAEHCTLDNWNQELSKENFYYLQAILSKTVGDRSLTPSDVYEALWLQKKVPLLLEAETSKDFKRIQSALRLPRNDLSVIVLTNVSVAPISKCLLDLNHLDEEHRNLILKHPITLQARPGARLADVINKPMHKLIKCKDIIDIISNRFNIGNTLGTILRFYVPRAVSKVLFAAHTLKQIDSKFLLRGIDPKTFDDISTGLEFRKTNEGTFIFESSSIKPCKDYHELSFLNADLFELKTSHACNRNLRQHQVIMPQDWYRKTQPDELWTSTEELYERSPCVINANPGMGKTELLNHVALHAPTTLWVLKVNLNEHHDYYKSVKDANKTALDHLQYFHSNQDELTEKIFLKFVKQKKVLVLLDGFDEISMTYKEEATAIATSLHQSGYKLWVSTRPVTQAHLEEALDTISRTLKPLVIEDQRKFLTQYFGHLAKDESQLRTVTEFVDKLLAAAAANLNDNDNRFTGLPLQTKLLADVFEKDLKRILETDEFVFNDKFDLIFLYDSFLEEKTNIFCRKFGDIYRDMRKFFVKLQQLVALRTLFTKDMLQKLRVKEKMEEFYEDDQQMVHFMQREGVVVVHRRDTNLEETFDASFVHYTFAEFLAAQWLYKNHKKKDVRGLLKCRFEEFYEFLFNIFDRYMAKDLPLHLSIINRNKREALDLITSDPTSAIRVDAGGRTIVHMLACYGLAHPSPYIYDSVGPDEFLEIIEALPESVITDAKDSLLGYNALEYALSHKTLSIADKLCQISKELMFWLDLNLKHSIFHYCDNGEYQHLFLLVLKHFVRKDLLQKHVNPQLSIESYCTSMPNLIEYASEYDSRPVIDVVRSTRLDDDIGFAAAFESEAELSQLLDRGVNVNKTDSGKFTALHYASYHNRLENAKLLLRKRADPNLLNTHGSTALHLAQTAEVASLLIAARADLNHQNKKGESALVTAIQYGRFEVAHLLIDEGIDLNLADEWDTTPLLYACKIGNGVLVEKILPSVGNIDHQNAFYQSALHMVMSYSRHVHDGENFETKLETVRLLLKNGIDVNLQDKYGDTALHQSCVISNEMRREHEAFVKMKAFNRSVASLLAQQPATDFGLKNVGGASALDVALFNKNNDWNIFEDKDAGVVLNLLENACDNPVGFVARFGSEADLLRLLDEGLDPNKVDRTLRTGLYHAVVHNRLQNAALLISRKADLNSRDAFGNTVLHVAGCGESVRLLSSAGADQNDQNRKGQSSLHLALQNRNFEVAHALLDEGADVNLSDASGTTALHDACKFARVDLVERIVPLVSDANAQDVDRRTVLHVLVSNASEDSVESRLRILQLLIDRGVDVNVQDKRGESAFGMICRRVEHGVSERSVKFGKAAGLIMLQGSGIEFDASDCSKKIAVNVALTKEEIERNVSAILEDES